MAVSNAYSTTIPRRRRCDCWSRCDDRCRHAGARPRAEYAAIATKEAAGRSAYGCARVNATFQSFASRSALE